MNQHYKHYDFKCTACSHEFRKGMWINREGQPEGSKCPECSDLQFPVLTDNQGHRIMINTQQDWTKKIPNDWSDFLQTFEKRHSKYDRTINTHKRGISEI